MEISAAGLVALTQLEGIALGPYRDSRGIWTSGIGHTAAAGGTDPALSPRVDSRNWSRAALDPVLQAALAQFQADLRACTTKLNGLITRPLAQHQFDALLSFEFNTGGLHRARLLREVNAGDFSGAGFMGWLKPKEIISRRKAERALFLSGNYAALGPLVPIYDVYGEGRLHYREAVAVDEILELSRAAKLADPFSRNSALGPQALWQWAAAIWLKLRKVWP